MKNARALTFWVSFTAALLLRGALGSPIPYFRDTVPSVAGEHPSEPPRDPPRPEMVMPPPSAKPALSTKSDSGDMPQATRSDFGPSTSVPSTYLDALRLCEAYDAPEAFTAMFGGYPVRLPGLSSRASRLAMGTRPELRDLCVPVKEAVIATNARNRRYPNGVASLAAQTSLIVLSVGEDLEVAIGELAITDWFTPEDEELFLAASRKYHHGTWVSEDVHLVMSASQEREFQRIVDQRDAVVSKGLRESYAATARPQDFSTVLERSSGEFSVLLASADDVVMAQRGDDAELDSLLDAVRGLDSWLWSRVSEVLR